MKYFKVGDAVSGAFTSAVYVVTAVHRLEVSIKCEHNPPFLFKKDKLQYSITVPAWIIKWREENMPPAPTEPLEPPANTEETKTVRILARENVKLAADLATTQSALRLTERDNLNLRIGARNDCDNIELMQAAIDELREETDAHIRRYTYAERDLRSATTTRDGLRCSAEDMLEKLNAARKELAAMELAGKFHQAAADPLRKELAAEKVHNENHAEHISKLCEELSQLKRARDIWMNNNGRNVKRVINLQEELAAEKAFNVSSELVARTGASDEIERLKAIQANGTSQIIHWRDRAEALQLKLSNINAMTREENDDG